jgi:hypothetical protein
LAEEAYKVAGERGRTRVKKGGGVFSVEDYWQSWLEGKPLIDEDSDSETLFAASCNGA